MKNIIKFILSFFSKKEDPKDFPGAILPTEEQLGEMPKLGELVSAINPVIWKPLDISKLPKYPVYSQNGSGSCVAMSICLIASILYKIRTGNTLMFSAAWIYQQRINRPSSGMIGTDAFKIASQGLLPEDLMPSQDLGESVINAVPTQPWFKALAGILALEDTLIQLPIKDIETVASVMQTTKKPVNVWYDFFRTEWTSVPFIIAYTIYDTFIRHSVVAIDYGMYDGEKAIAIQESWGVGATMFGTVRIIKESFHRQRNLFAAYPRKFKFDVTAGDKPSYTGSIVSFQKCMLSIGLFPVGIPFAENWGVITTQTCKKFQEKYGITQTGTLGPITTAKLYETFP